MVSIEADCSSGISSGNCFKDDVEQGRRSGGLANDSDAVRRINENVFRPFHHGESFKVADDAFDFNVIFAAGDDHEITLFLQILWRFDEPGLTRGQVVSIKVLPDASRLRRSLSLTP